MDTHSTLSDALALFALDNAARRLTPRTQAGYAASLHLFAAWCAEQGATRLVDITPALLRRFQIALQARSTVQGKPLSSVYIHNLLRAVRRLLAFCVAEELLARSPFGTVRMPKVERKVLHALTSEELGRVLAACKTPRDKALVGFLLDTGARAAELCSLTVGALDMQSGAVLIERGKGQKGRYVYLGAQGRKALRRYLVTRNNPPAGAPLFCALRGGRPLTPNAIVQLMRRLRRTSGVVNLSAHACRRTFALACLRSGMDVHTLRLLMGHSDIDVLRQYLDLADSDLQRAHAQHSPLDALTSAPTPRTHSGRTGRAAT